ncbi:hypothetical protein SAMN02745150_00257 [Brevinema andersonii]|uniref:DUF5723 domain-containing protein n=1 Tax=Brevinema andersonii TaxID=34097 RepID=A0A1I1D8X9_BREAD|nr:hypothetical protein [Brevinema andersonii]SFB69270.1 hypothetical protein SAMN02745150_00257 [Brevinema andersonii]
MKNLLLSIIFSSVVLPARVFAASYATEQRIWKDAASMGMGGVGVSTYGYRFSAIRNPAMLGLMNEHTIIPFIDIGMVIDPGMISLIKDAKGVLDGSKDYAQLDYDSMMNRVANIGINGPLSVGFFGKGLGVWTTSSSDVSFGFRLSDHPLVQGISLNALVSTSKEVLNLIEQSNGDINKVNTTALVTTLTNGLLESLIGSGKSEAEAVQHVNNLINQYVGTSGKDYVGGKDTIPSTATVPKLDPKELLPLASLTAVVEMTANIGYGYQIPFAGLDDVSGLALGGTFRFSQRFKMSEKDADITELVGRYSQNALANIYQGQSFSSDFGMTLRIQNWVAAIAVRDAFSTAYKWKPLDGKISFLPDSQIPMSLDFGTSYKFFFKNKFIQEIGMYFEFEDTLNKMTDWSMKIRTGVEFKLLNFLDLRFGMYDLFPTAGVGMGWKWGRIDFSYYRKTYFGGTPLAFYSDQLYLNFSLGLDNTPARKKAAKERKAAKIKARRVANELAQDIIDDIKNP